MPAPVKNKLEYYLSRTTVDTDGCMIWQGATQSNGYGSVRINNKKVYIHVYVGLETHQDDLDALLDSGVDPDTIVVMHKCDKRGCIRPSCLAVTIQAINLKDAYDKGRLHPPEPKRDLTPEQVQDIRYKYNTGMSTRQIGQLYNINHGNVSRIVRGLSYAD